MHEDYEYKGNFFLKKQILFTDFFLINKDTALFEIDL